jgi:asparagine synthase (glutamine-hydrolysing)
MLEPPRLNEGRVADYLVGETRGIDYSQSIFENVQRLPPASTMVFRDGRMRIRNYWCPEALAALEVGSDEEYLEQFHAVLRKAVARGLRADRPVAATLSGGVDSSVIVALAAELRAAGETRGKGLLGRTLSQVNDDEADCNESACIRAVVASSGVGAECLNSDMVAQHAAALVDWSANFEDPSDGLGLQRFLLYQVAGRFGHRVVFDGLDGDLAPTLPFEYPSFLAVQGKWLPAATETFKQWTNYHDRRLAPWRPPAHLLWSLFAPRSLRDWKQARKRRRELQGYIHDNLLRPEFAEQVALSERYERYCATLAGGGFEQNRRGELSAAHIARIRVPYLADAAERCDRIAAAAGVEARHPLLDRDFVEFCIRSPWNQLSRNGWSKYGLRLLAAELLPQQIAWRRDNGNLAWQYFKRWMVDAREGMIERLMSDPGPLPGWIDWTVFSTQVQQYRMNPDLMTDYRVWQYDCLNTWLRRHL